MVPDSKKMDIEYIKESIKQYGITNASMVPGMYETLLENVEKDDLACFRFIVLAGEKSHPALIKKSKEKE